jgi:hypothetical protein
MELTCERCGESSEVAPEFAPFLQATIDAYGPAAVTRDCLDCRTEADRAVLGNEPCVILLSAS